VPIKTDNAYEIEFGNGSGVEVGVSLRSGTKNFMHVSEYGKICAKAPDKAKEIKSGTLNTIAPRQLVFIESTAEGRAGDFYDKTQQARLIGRFRQELGRSWTIGSTSSRGGRTRPIRSRASDYRRRRGKYFEEPETEHGIKLRPAKVVVRGQEGRAGRRHVEGISLHT
jgi:hypothetical protein